MKIYAMSDIHGCSEEFDCALSFVLPHLNEPDTMLILLGDYINGYDSYGVLKRIVSLQKQYGTEKVLALKGNHEEMFCDDLSDDLKKCFRKGEKFLLSLAGKPSVILCA